jgi:thiamine kinase-like enzyme
VDARELIELIPELRGKSLTVTPLSGGLTNRNERIDAGGESFVLRISDKETVLLGIERDCEVACSRAAAALGVGPELIAYLPEHGATLRRFVAGRVLASKDLQEPVILRRVVEAVRRYHEGPPGAGHFSAFAAARQYLELAQERRVVFPDSLDLALEWLARLEETCRNEDPPCPCHNDLLAGNFVDTGAEMNIIDWEYAGMGDRFFDLGNLAANNEFDVELERTLLDLYFGEVRPDQQRRLRVMRLVSDLRESMWGFLQSAISNLDIDYLAYGRKHLERFLECAAKLEQKGGGSF